MKLEHWPRHGYRRTAWRNGGGMTSEIARAPLAGEGDDFLWRLSLAEVAASGPFSLFPGYDRLLLQLSGAPMRLVGGGEDVLLRPEQPYLFPGERSVHAEIAGPTLDFNCMVRRGQVMVNSALVSIGPEELLPPFTGKLVLFVLSGDCRIRAGDQDVRLEPLDTALIEADAHFSTLTYLIGTQARLLKLHLIELT